MSAAVAYLHAATLFGFLAVAAFTDMRWRKIFNATTYTGALIGLIVAALNSWLGDEATGPTLFEGLTGLLACGAVMVACYICFPNGIGGGDVKLIALVGAYLGVFQGLEALLWCLLLGAGVALIRLVWMLGAVELLRRMKVGLCSLLTRGGFGVLTNEEKQQTSTDVFLGPCALAGVLIVQLGVLVP